MISITLNAILVNENIRPAMMIQPIDYGKKTKTNKMIDFIKHYFPNLIFSENYEDYQGIIVSKTNYNERTDISSGVMGQLLGYPCFQDFDHIDSKKISYNIDVNVELEDGTILQLFANKCLDKTKIDEFNDFVVEAKIAFAKEEYKGVLGIEVKNVFLTVEQNIPTQIIIDDIVENKPLDEDKMKKIKNIMYNFGFSTSFLLFIDKNFQYTNLVHRGILLGLLMNEMNNLLSPFLPLHKYLEQDKQVHKMIEDWEKDLTRVLERTKQTVIGGKGRKTRRIKLK